MAQIIVAEIEAYDPAIYSTRTLRYGTQAFQNDGTPISEPTLDPRLTVTRAGVATRVNRLGLIETVAANTARFDYEPVTKALRGLLVEESRANLLRYSSDFSAVWTLAGSTRTSNAAVAPDGSTTAIKLTPDTTLTAKHIQLFQTDLTTVGVAYTVSVYAKAAGYDRVVLWWSNTGATVTFDLSAGTLINSGGATGSIVSVGNGWYRCASTYTQPTSNGPSVRFYVAQPGTVGATAWTVAANGTSGIFLWGAQLEVGSFATSYIPTVATAVTRNRDDISMTGANFTPWYNSTEGTLFAEWEQGTTAVTVPAGITDGTVSNRVTIVGGTSIGGRITVGGVATDPAAATGGTGIHRSAIALKSGDSAQYTNGALNSVVSPSGTPTVNRLELGGQPATATAYLNGWLRQVTYWPTRLTNDQLQALTSGNSIPTSMSLSLDFMLGANAFFENRIQQPANIKREVFANGRTFGKTQIGYGEMVLVNNDGALDELLNYSFVGRRITITLGTMLPYMSAPVWTTILSGTMEQVDLSWNKVTVRVRDRQLDLAKPLQEVRYAGTGGLEGGSDLEGKPKPLVYGKVLNIAPPQTDTTRRIYQLHSGGSVVSVDAVYDRGLLLTAGAAYTSQADMEANAPTGSQYRVWNDATAGCFVRLGSAPVGTVTADVTQGATRTVGQLFNAILLKAGIQAANISSADITALDAAVNFQVGVFAGYQQDRSAIDMLDELCASVGAWYGADATGMFRIGRIVLPTGTEVGTITKTDIIKIERIASRDPGVGVPSWRVKVAYEKIHTVQVDLGSNISDGRKQFTASEYRRATASDSSVRTANLLSPELEFKTVLVNKADAASEASRLLNIYKARRDVYQVTIRVDATLAAALDLGKIVMLQIDRFGMDAGKKFLIIGITTNMRGYQYELTLWG